MSNNFSDITNALVTLLSDNWSTLSLNGPEDVYYGDQARYPRTPAIAVESPTVRKDLTAIGQHATNTIDIYILVFHTPLQSMELTREECDKHAESVADLLEANRTLSGLVIHSHVALLEPGVVDRAGSIIKTTRLTWTGISKTRIGA